MKTSDVFAFFETQTKAAEALGMAQSSVAGWGEYPPELRQIQLERITGGKLKAEPSCYGPVNGSTEQAAA